jgi:hypothetical protein
MTGSRQENAMRTDGIGATQPVDVNLQSPDRDAKSLNAA